MGARPADPAHAVDYDDVVELVTQERAKVTLAELALHAGALPTRPHLVAATMAERSLHELRTALDTALERQRERRIAEGIERATRTSPSDALAALGAARRAPTDEHLLGGVESEELARHQIALERLDALPEVDPQEVADLRAAMAVRDSRRRHETLANPPAWVRAHVTSLASSATQPDVGRLAQLYGDVAVEVELAGAAVPDLASLHQALVVRAHPTPMVEGLALSDPPSAAPDLGL